MRFWNPNKAVITLRIDYAMLFDRYPTEGIDKKASRAEFLKMAKAAIERCYKAKVIAWGMDYGADHYVTVEAPQSTDVILSMEHECLGILSRIHSGMEWVVMEE